jgi:hypothetical protein
MTRPVRTSQPMVTELLAGLESGKAEEVVMVKV